MAAVGAPLVSLGKSADGPRAVVGVVRGRLARGDGARRTVRLELGGDVLELSEATAADQQRLIEALRQQARGHLMAGRRRALIVANDVNEHEGLERLPAPAADAEALAAVLGDAAIGGFEVDVVHNEPAHVIQGRIEDLFAESRIDDVLLLHFSCHGLKAVRATPARRRWVYVAAGVALLALAAAVVAYVLASFSGPRVVALRQDTEFQASA